MKKLLSEENGQMYPPLPPYIVTGGLGRGGFGVVVSVKNIGTGEEFAMKKIPKYAVDGLHERQKNLARELILMTNLPYCAFLLRLLIAGEAKEPVS
mmetsp:Transcript_7949/g.18153  ORF Transcript_7949/g.18153 Transcript_7949/m.18153 type:complete len:96 (+) Transcript_7949:207-494(+)